MKKSKFTESPIVQALKEHEAGKNVDDISVSWDQPQYTLQLKEKVFGYKLGTNE